MFKNATFFRFAPAVGLDILCRLEDEIKMLPLRDLDRAEMETRGFVAPSLGGFAHWVGTACYLSIAMRRRIISAAMVNEVLAKQIAQIEHHENRTPGARERRRMKEEIVVDLMPHAPIVTKRIDCLLHCGENWIAVDTGGMTVAEDCIGMIRFALGSFPAMPLLCGFDGFTPRNFLTDWLRGEPATDLALDREWALGNRCKLIGDDGAIANYSAQELSSDEIRDNLEAGKHVKQLGIVMRDHVSAVLTTDLTFKSIKFLDDAGFADAEDREQLLALQALELEIVARDLFALFQCETPE